MKKATLISGVISSFLFLLGLVFKVQHWQGAGVVLFVSVIIFALGYSPLLMVDRNKLTQNGYQKFVNIVSMITMSLVAIFFLFKAMHWPCAGIGVIAGNLLLLAMIPVLFVHASKETDTLKRLNFYNEAILLVLITTFSLFIWLVISHS